jgi:hypothetical protein
MVLIIFMLYYMACFICCFYILGATQALISSVRVLQSDSSQLYYMPNAELFLVPQHLPRREHTQCTTVSLVRAVPHREQESDSLTHSHQGYLIYQGAITSIFLCHYNMLTI